jgi:aminoglycoside phosphotransferase (APT) family kinase protein
MTVFGSVFARLTGRSRARAQAADVSLHGTLAKNVIAELSDRLGHPCELVDLHATRTGSLIVRIQADRAYIAKVPLLETTAPRLWRSAQVLQTLGSAEWMTPALAARCPSIVLCGTSSDHFYSVETAVPGNDGASMLKAGSPHRKDMIVESARFLADLQRASYARQTPELEGWQPHFDLAVARVEELAARAGAAPIYRALVADLQSDLAAHRLPAVYSHGNFWLGNALFDAASKLTGVIDWDSADERALPALDLLYLLVRSHKRAEASVGEAFVDWLEADSLPFLDACSVDHCDDLTIPSSLVGALSYCAWIQHVDAHCVFGTPTATDPRWLRRNVRIVLDRWQQSRSTLAARARKRWQRNRG